MSARQTRGLRIRTQCKTLDELVRVFHRFVDETSIFVPTPSPRQEGIEAAFSIDLASGDSALVGQGVVLGAWTTRDNRFGQAGMQIGVRKVTPASVKVYEQMLIARALAKDSKESAPESWEDGTDIATPAFDDRQAVPQRAIDLVSAPIEGAPIVSSKHTLLGLPIIPHAPASPASEPNTAAPVVAVPRVATKPMVSGGVKPPTVVVTIPATVAPKPATAVAAKPVAAVAARPATAAATRATAAMASVSPAVEPMITVKPKLSPNAFVGVPARIAPKNGAAPAAQPSPIKARPEIARASEPAMPRPVKKPSTLTSGWDIVDPAPQPEVKPGKLTMGWDAQPEPTPQQEKPRAEVKPLAPLAPVTPLAPVAPVAPLAPVVARGSRPAMKDPEPVADAVPEPITLVPPESLAAEPAIPEPVPAAPEPIEAESAASEPEAETKPGRPRLGTVLGSGPVPRLPAGMDGAADVFEPPYEIPDEESSAPQAVDPELTERDVVNHFALAAHGLAAPVEVAPIAVAVPVDEPSINEPLPLVEPPPIVPAPVIDAVPVIDAAPVVEAAPDVDVDVDVPVLEPAPVVEAPVVPVEAVPEPMRFLETQPVVRRRRRRRVGLAIALVAIVCAGGGFAAGLIAQQQRTQAAVEAPSVDVASFEAPAEVPTSDVALEPVVPLLQFDAGSAAAPVAVVATPVAAAPVAVPPVAVAPPSEAPVAEARVEPPSAKPLPTATRVKRPIRTPTRPYVAPRPKAKAKRACDDLSCL
ncbi:MAG TPA: hypothetical protein VFV99_18985 [Kofleriaceae bacterium]|nr:hypothetical protein [Kofleriaceae bacterium]